jgi:hypothetical protein
MALGSHSERKTPTQKLFGKAAFPIVFAKPDCGGVLHNQYHIQIVDHFESRRRKHRRPVTGKVCQSDHTLLYLLCMLRFPAPLSFLSRANSVPDHQSSLHTPSPSTVNTICMATLYLMRHPNPPHVKQHTVQECCCRRKQFSRHNFCTACRHTVIACNKPGASSHALHSSSCCGEAPYVPETLCRCSCSSISPVVGMSGAAAAHAASSQPAPDMGCRSK